MYSLIRVWIGLKLARMLIQVSVVVRTTSATDSPSAPSLYWIPKIGIQSTVSTNWKPGSPGQVADQQEERDDPGHDREAERDRPRPTTPGRSAMTSAPTSGRNVTIDRIGMPSRSIVSGPPAARYEPAMTISPIAMPSA